MERRSFLSTSAIAGAGLLLTSTSLGADHPKVPHYLKGNKKLYHQNPRKAAIEWFGQARYGMFLHYGLYSIVGRHEWLQQRETIPVAEYAKLKEQFTADKFNADFITDLALEAGMKYINITTRHHDGFCLWDTKYSDFKSTNSPAKRDLIAELSEQCNKKAWPYFSIIHMVAIGSIPMLRITMRGKVSPDQTINPMIQRTSTAKSTI